MEANLKKVIRSQIQNDLVHVPHNSNAKGIWIVKKDNNLLSNTKPRTEKSIWIVKTDKRSNAHSLLFRMYRRGNRTRGRRNKPWEDKCFYRAITRNSCGYEGNGWGDDLVVSNLTKECQKLHIGGHSSWSGDEIVEGGKETTKLNSNTKHDEEESSVSMDIFPDELQEQILSLLPFTSIMRARCVCKMWNEIVVSKKFQEFISSGLSKKPWYFMSNNPDKPAGFLYDPMVKSWHYVLLPFNMKHGSNIASSHGLVCYVDTDRASDVLVCNPITRSCKKLVLPLGGMNFEYHGMAISVDSRMNRYNVAVVRSVGYDVLINVYSSETLDWSCRKKSLQGWKGRADCVIFEGKLYLLVLAGDQHGLFVHGLSGPSDEDDTIIAIPFTITCGRLINLQDKLVMVGGIGVQGRLGVISGIGIWVLRGTEWEEVARVPPRLLQVFGELDDVFASTGGGETIYIHTYGRTKILLFDMSLREWTRTLVFPLNKKYPLQLFTGFCFYPRLDIST